MSPQHFEARILCRGLEHSSHLYASHNMHTAAYVSIRQHTSAYVSTRCAEVLSTPVISTLATTCIRQHTSAYVSIRQHTLCRGLEHSGHLCGSENISHVTCVCVSMNTYITPAAARILVTSQRSSSTHKQPEACIEEYMYVCMYIYI